MPQGSLLMQRKLLKSRYDLLADSSRDTGKIMYLWDSHAAVARWSMKCMSRRLAWLPAVRLIRPVTGVIIGRGLISNHITSSATIYTVPIAMASGIQPYSKPASMLNQTRAIV